MCLDPVLPYSPASWNEDSLERWRMCGCPTSISMEEVEAVINSQDLRKKVSENGEKNMLMMFSQLLSVPQMEGGFLIRVALIMCPNRDWFVTYRSFDGGKVLMGNNVACKVVGIGSIQIRMHDGGVMRTMKGALVVIQGLKQNSLYLLQGSTVTGATTSSSDIDCDTTKLWHMRLGHMSERGMDVLSQQGLLGSKKIGELEFCEHCVFGKQCRVKFSRAVHTTKGTVDYIHSDLWGPSTVPSKGGGRYMLTFIDDFSRKVWVYILKKKNEDDGSYSTEENEEPQEYQYNIAKNRPRREIRPPQKYGYADMVAYALSVAESIEVEKPVTYKEAIKSTESADMMAKHIPEIKIIKSVDDALQLSQTYKIQVFELGHALVLSFFSIVICLVDGILDDWGLKISVGDGHNMDVEFEGYPNFKRHEPREQIRTTNSLMALEVLGNLTNDRKAMALLRLVHFNIEIKWTCKELKIDEKFYKESKDIACCQSVSEIGGLNLHQVSWHDFLMTFTDRPEKYDGLLQRMQLLEAHNLSHSNMASASQPLLKLSANIQRALVFECQSNKRQLIGMLTSIASRKPASCCASEAGRFACWVPLDIYMENAMDGKQFPVTSAVDILAETIGTLQVFNGASWHETFLALWLSALRIERDPLEGPIPHLEARLCVLLSIVPLAIAHVVEDNSTFFAPILSEGMESRYKETGLGKGGIGHSSRKQGLIISLQLLGRYPALLYPPASAVSSANDAAAKAINFISKSSAKNGISLNGCGNSFVKAGGDMRHLIVEACIARNLVDASAYFWPGYISASVVSQSDPSLLERSPWSTLMDGAPLTGALVNALLTTPASCYLNSLSPLLSCSSLVEIEKLYHIALNGPEEEKSAAAKILCGASLSRGWNIQEHVVHFVVKLLSPPVPPKFTGARSHLVDYMPMLSAILFGAASIDTVHILSLHGVVPEVAASLMPLCETFGSLVPASCQKSSTYDETSIYMVFSSAFLFLLRLWKFYRPPLEQCITGRVGAIGSELTLEYLLLLRNSRMQSSDRPVQDKIHSSSNMHILLSDRPIYIDSYPKLRTWYCQNKSCIASTLSGLGIENPVHQVAFKILNLMYGKLTRSGTVSSNSSTPSSNTTSGSPESAGEDASPIPMLSAWEVLEAVPYVLEATLTACAHGRLSPRDLTTGLRDLVDFLPASLASMISYFSAEVTRGIWKPVPMNGKDWPSPAANLISVESEIKEILTAAGVEFPSYSSGTCLEFSW
ncbi:hypothetical protein RJ639_002766 [Escallonia herrerae]|uniref:GAG-pre-integrase domain-containing protein n=1 Tax=Escallonia herrerae TaxID=1293975 RepID=A0AA88W1N8_9ASTE|nr:hypothetical protein RJ639_002766 [Escallonia herrerae]